VQQPSTAFQITPDCARIVAQLETLRPAHHRRRNNKAGSFATAVEVLAVPP
jgi:hypothetical protein